MNGFYVYHLIFLMKLWIWIKNGLTISTENSSQPLLQVSWDPAGVREAVRHQAQEDEQEQEVGEGGERARRAHFHLKDMPAWFTQPRSGEACRISPLDEFIPFKLPFPPSICIYVCFHKTLQEQSDRRIWDGCSFTELIRCTKIEYRNFICRW